MGKAFTLRNGLILLSTEAPGGIYNSAQLKKVSALCDENTAIVKATEDQRLALFVKPEHAEKVKKELQSVGLGIRHYQDGLHQPVNCVGNLCKESLQDALGTSMALQKELASLALSSSLRIGINGCYRCCVPTHTLDISVIGDTKGYRISLGGKNSQIPEMAIFMAENVPAEEIPRLIRQIITIYQKHVQEDESLQDVLDRVGTSEFVKALHPYSQDAAGADDPFGDVGGGIDAAEAPAGDELLTDDLAMEDASGGEMLGEELSTDDLGAGDLAMDDLGTDDLGTDALAMDDLGTDALAMDDLGDLEVASADLAGDSMDAVAIDSDDLGELSMDGDVTIGDSGAGEMSDEIDFGDADQTAAGELTIDDNFDADVGVSDDEMMGDLASLEADTGGDIALEGEPEFEQVGDEMPLDESGNTLDAEEIAESEADEFEKKLNESIEEEESMPAVEDENSESRLAAVRLVEAAGVDEGGELAMDGDSESVALDMDDADVADFDNLEIERDSADFGDDIDHIDLSPEVFDESMDELAETGSGAPVTPMPVAAPAASGAGSDLCGIDFQGGDKIALRFGNGAEIAIALSSLRAGRREITAFGKSIGIRQTNNGVNIEVDGLSVFYPRAAA
jgi:hypothetical protein